MASSFDSRKDQNMRLFQVFSLAALSTLIAISFMAKAQADLASSDMAPSTSPMAASPVGARGVDEAGKCTQDFVMGYSMTGRQIQTMAAYYKAYPNQVPPNLGAVLLACSRFESAFPSVSCSALKADKSVVTVTSAELIGHCATIRQFAAQFPSNNPSGSVSDSSPISTINPKNLSASVSNSSKLQAAAAQPGMVYIIDGEVLSLGSALLRDAPVRCAILRETKSPLSISNGDLLKGSDVDEAYANNTHISQIAFGNVDMIIRCATKGTNALTLGDLKNAFSGILNFSYAP
jgi:hypothetical protein